MGIKLKIKQMEIGGLPFTCPECDTVSFTLDARGPIDALATVWANCSNYHSWEVLLLTIDDLRQIQAASTGRANAGDDDTFHLTVGDTLLEGVLQPELVLDDLKTAGRAYWKRIIKPAMRRQKKAAFRAAKKPVTNAVAAGKAAAIGAAWGLQAGGREADPDYRPEPVNPCPVCDEGYIAIDSRLHAKTKVRCSVCQGTGEI